MARRTKSEDGAPRDWRLDGTDPRTAGSLYEFVRRTLSEHRGVCTRTQLLEAILADPNASDRLKRTRGFSALLNNMKHSGFIQLEAELVRRTKRRYGSTRT